VVFGRRGVIASSSLLELAGRTHCGGMKIGLRHGRQQPQPHARYATPAPAELRPRISRCRDDSIGKSEKPP